MKIKELVSSSSNLPVSFFGKAGIALGSLALGQWIFTDIVHLPGGGLGLVTLGAGLWWFAQPSKGSFDSPTSIQGWINRCKEVIDQFQSLEEASTSLIKKEERLASLDAILERSDKQSIAFIGDLETNSTNKSDIENAIDNQSLNVQFFWEPSLPLDDKSWILPEKIYKRDLVVYILQLPLRASDLLWINELPEKQPSWLMISCPQTMKAEDKIMNLYAQLPNCWENRILNIQDKNLKKALLPIRKVLDNPSKNLDMTSQRLLSKLHSSWQIDLEKLRRQKFRDLQKKTQWIVAGTVFASPVPSTDLLAIAVVNGLMIQEMANIWSCRWNPEVLQVVAKQLVGAAIAQGTIEWSGQALLSVGKFHGSTWLAAGALQALSAAYLTRVVGRSMADWMALNNGVDSCDLEALKIKAPEIVKKASLEERVDWHSFIKQAQQWIKENNLNRAHFDYSLKGLN